MSGGGALNLSLLSRGIGEVQKNGHEKVEVFLEPSDYFNFGADRPYYMPPIQPTYHFAETSLRQSTRSARDGFEFPLPKTFTTRKGALLLFSEDMAMKSSSEQELQKKSRRHHPLHTSFSPHSSYEDDVLKTVDDLAKSILQYGGAKHEYEDENKMYLKFIHRRREQWERQIRPGYSAKRYLATWTRNWDDQVFETVVSKGYLTERSLFHYNLFLPNLRRQLFHEDLSNMPQPYRLMKSMLLTPGSLSGYTFYREAASREFGALLEESEEEAEGMSGLKRADTKRSIRVVRTTKEGMTNEVSYSALDKDTQREVITDLLVKSAVHYALSKQEEIMEESIKQAIQQSEHGGDGTSYPELSEPGKTPAPQSVPGFNMRDAVDAVRVPYIPTPQQREQQKKKYRTSKHHYLLKMRKDESLRLRRLGSGLLEQDVLDSSILTHIVSLLDSHRSVGGPVVLGDDLPDSDARSHSSDHTGSFKGGSVPQHAAKGMGARQTPRGSWPSAPEEAGREYLGDMPVAAVRDMSTASSSVSSIPQLPPIGKVPLSPIRDVSRETSQLVTLPPINKGADEDAPTVYVMPPTPQHTSLVTHSTPRHDHKALEIDPAIAEISNDSSPVDPYPTPAHTQRAADKANRKNKSKGPKVTHGAEVPKATGILFQLPELEDSHPQYHRGFSTSSSHPPVVGAGPNWEYGRLVEGHGHRTARSLAATSLESKSLKGSMIMAPDGEIISVGGSVAPTRPHDVGVINDVTQQQHLYDANTDESGQSDDEPEEWKSAAEKVKKARSMSSKRSDSLKRGAKRERETQTSLRGSAVKSVASSDLDEQFATSRGSIIIKKYSIGSREAETDSVASASLRIDYKSGDIDATISMHNWSYGHKNEEGEGGGGGMVKAGSMRSLPDGVQKESLSTLAAEQAYLSEAEHDDDSEEDDERWARITERPDEEDNMMESRERTMDPYLPPNTDHFPDPSPRERQSSKASSSRGQQQHPGGTGDRGESRSSSRKDQHFTPRADSRNQPHHTTPARSVSKKTTPAYEGPEEVTPISGDDRLPSGLTPGDGGPSPGQSRPVPAASKTPGDTLGPEPVPSANGPRPTPASVSVTPPAAGAPDEEDEEEDEAKEPGTARSRSIALQTDSASEYQSPRGFGATPCAAPDREASDAEGEGEEQWPAEGGDGKDALDVVPEESVKGSAAPSRLHSSTAAQSKTATPAASRSQTAAGEAATADSRRTSEGKVESVNAEARKTDSKAESRKADSKAESRKADSKAESRKADSKAESRKADSKAESRKADSKAESRKAESKAESRAGDSVRADSKAGSRQSSSKEAPRSREPSSKRASRTGSAQGDAAGRAEQNLAEPSVIKEETHVTDRSSAAESARREDMQEEAERAASPVEEEGDAEPAEHATSQSRTSKDQGPSRSDKAGSQAGPTPANESGKPSRAPSKAGSRGPSQASRLSNEVAAAGKTSAAPSPKSDAARSGGAGSSQQKSSKDDAKSRVTSSKTSSHHSQQAKSRATGREGSRSVSTRLSQAHLASPPPGEEEASADHRWDEEDEGGGVLPDEDGGGGGGGGDSDSRNAEEFQPPSTPSLASGDTAKVSGEECPAQGMALSIEGTQLLTPPDSPSYGRRTQMTLPESVLEEPEDETATLASQAGRSSVTEQDVLDTLTEHAKRIADSVLSSDEAGMDLEKDVRSAADMWMDTHSNRDVSRSQSVHDALPPGAIEEIMNVQRTNSAGPSPGEYKDLIRQSLTTAVAKAAGLDPEQFPEDAEISPDLLDALANQKLTPEDIAITHDEETGRPVIKSRAEIAQALGGVAAGHIYVALNGKAGSHAGSEAGGIKRQMSIPADRASLVDNMDYDVISYGGEVDRTRPAGRSKAGSKPGSIAGGTVADLKERTSHLPKGVEDAPLEAEHDEFKQRLEQMETAGDKKSPSVKSAEDKTSEPGVALPTGGSPKLQRDVDGQSDKTGVSHKTEKSDESKKKKAKSPEEPFIVGKTDKKGELGKLYGTSESPPRKKDSIGSKSGDITLDKSPRAKENSPRPKDKSPIKSNKSPRVDPVGAEAAVAPQKEAAKEKEPKQKRSRTKKEKTAFPRRGSRSLEAELKAKEEKEKEASQVEMESEPSVLEKEEEAKVVPEKQAPSPKELEVPGVKEAQATREPSAKAAQGSTTPRAADAGMPKQKGDLSQLYGTQGPGTLPQTGTKADTKSLVKGKKPKKEEKEKKEKSKKGKKGKGKKGKEATPDVEATPVEETPAPEVPAPVVEKEPTPEPPPSQPLPTKPLTASSSERPVASSPEYKTDDDMEFNIVREESSPEPEPQPKVSIPPSFPEEPDEEEEEEIEVVDGDEDNLKSISNREARAAKRAAAAAKRKEEVERRRKEREEQLKKEKEEQERQEQLKKEMEIERRRREEERRLRKQKEAEEAANEEKAKEDAEKKKRMAEERERKAKEDYIRKLEDMRKKQIEEEAKRMELLLEKQREEEARRAEEELMMSQMAEQERLEYEKKRRQEEEERKRKEEEERLKREEEARKAMEEAKRLAEEMARKQAELEARLKFNRSLQVEAGGLDHSQDINRAFVFSYFELLQWLGLDIPEFELAKMSQL